MTYFLVRNTKPEDMMKKISNQTTLEAIDLNLMYKKHGDIS